MRPDDFFVKPPPRKPKTIILFSGAGYFHFRDEYFVIADGVASLPHASEAEALAVDTAMWAYDLVRRRTYYWTEKRKFLKRIFRSTNLRLWQKRRDPGFEDGLATALMVLITTGDYFWIGSAGNCNSFLFRDGLIEILTKRDVDSDGMLTKAAGFARKQLLPHERSERLLEGDVLVMTTDNIAQFVGEEELRAVLEQIGTTPESMQSAVDALVARAKTNGSRDHLSLCLVKRIVV